MGYLTPLLFRNDSLDMLKKDPDTLNKIESACHSLEKSAISLVSYSKSPWWKFWKKQENKGICCNPIESLGTRHADDSRVIVIYGNSWIDLYDEIWKHEKGSIELDHKIDKTHMSYLKKCIKIAKDTIKCLELVLKKNEH